MTRDDIQLYMMGQYDGDVAALERAIVDDADLGAIAAEEAALELALREAASAATFCPACDDLVRGPRCNACGAAVRPGGYTIERVLVANAHGRMYVAHDADGTQVALKELAFVHAPSLEAIAAFEREARFLRALAHPRIPRFLSSFDEGGGVHARYYLAQELVTGTPLDRLDDHWYSEDEIVEIAKQVLEILVYLQGLSPMVIHRDIKPANLLRRPDGTIALVDFGAAHVHGATAASTTIGTFGYMPIEQLAGEVDATTDPYALGATLIHLLTRQEPWRIAQTRAAINVSAPLRAFIDKLVAPAPRDRFPSAKDALAALDRRAELAPRRRRKLARPAMIATAAIALAAGGGLATFALTGNGERNAERPRRTTYSPPSKRLGWLLIRLPQATKMDLEIDHARVMEVQDGQTVSLEPGPLHVTLRGRHGESCENDVLLEAGNTTTIECNPVRPRLHVSKQVTWSHELTHLSDALREFAITCDVNVVSSDVFETSFRLELEKAPCDAALDEVLASKGLSYVYDEADNLVRIAAREDLKSTPSIAGDPLPSGRDLDLDLRGASLREALNIVLAGSGGHINLVVPEWIEGHVTLHLTDVPWQRALREILASQDLSARYIENGHLLRVTVRKDGEE